VRVVQLNLAADFAITTPHELLDRYHTLTGWADALVGAGADVSVVQRYARTATLERRDITYHFVCDDDRPMLRPWSVSQASVERVCQLEPDVVHLNGLMFPAMTQALRDALPGSSSIVLQDHSGHVPSPSRFIRPLVVRRWRRAFDSADACLFTARELATRWHPVGLSQKSTVIEIPEASTTFEPFPLEQAREHTGVAGSPAILWVGRLTADKDPVTVIRGFVQARRAVPDAQLWMIVPGGEDELQLRQMIATVPGAESIHVRGPIAFEEMAWFYSAADLLVSGSRHEGSGYAVIEAMACGATPCVSDIAPFRALTAGCGRLWRLSDVDACAEALIDSARQVSPTQRQAVRSHFDRHLSWREIGRKAHDAYATLQRSHPQ
jgi:glycosyltransferase involved in cell wall biosynthesis